MNNLDTPKPLEVILSEIQDLSICLDQAMNTVVRFCNLIDEATQRVIETEFGKHEQNCIAGNHEQKIWLQVGYDRRPGNPWWARAIGQESGFRRHADTPRQAIDEALKALAELSVTDAEALRSLIKKPL